MPTLSAAQQIAQMKTLKQAAAAWLLGVSGHKLRDHPDVPRNEDGSYEASEAVRYWSRKTKVEAANLRPHEHERCLIAVERACPEIDCYAALLALLDDLENGYGAGGLIAFVRVFTEYTRKAGEDYYYSPPRVKTQAELQAAIEAAQEREFESLAWREFRISIVCESCGRLRQGDKWVDQAPPANHRALKGICPPCEKKEQAST